MPLRKVASSPHLSNLALAAKKSQVRKAKVEFAATATKVHRNGSLKKSSDTTSKLKKCFSSPHLKDLKELPDSTSGPGNHETSSFRDEVINCRFRSCGCMVRLSRERMDSHLRTNSANHSLLLLNKIDDLGRKNETIFKRLSNIENSMVSVMNLFENLQEVLASNGVSTSSRFSKAVLDNKEKNEIGFNFGSGKKSMDTEKVGPRAQNSSVDISRKKRIPDHLDLAIASQPAKRHRKGTPTAELTSNYSPDSMIQNPPQFPSGIPLYPGTHASLSVSSASILNGSMAMSSINTRRSTSATGQSFSQIGQPMELQPISNASLTAQTKQAARRVQSMIENKGKGSSRRKARGRFKKGKAFFEAPKKPKTAYNYYQIGVRESILAEITAENSSASKEVQSQKVARIIGERWKSMPENEREAFNTLALQDKQRYKRELEEYVQLKAQLKASMGNNNAMASHRMGIPSSPYYTINNSVGLHTGR